MIKIVVKVGINQAVFNGETLTYEIGALPDQELTIKIGGNQVALFNDWTTLDYIVFTSTGVTSTTVTKTNPYVPTEGDVALEADLLLVKAKTESYSSRYNITLDTTLPSKASQTSVDAIATTLLGMALEATLTAIKGAGWSSETLKNIRDVVALETSLTAIKGSGWSTETLKVIKDAITALNNLSASGVWGYSSRTLTNVDNVWTVATRALTDKATLL